MNCPHCSTRLSLPPAPSIAMDGMRKGASSVNPNAEALLDMDSRKCWMGGCPCCGRAVTLLVVMPRPQGFVLPFSS